MPSEKAKDNKNLVATCAACSKSVSTESAVALTGAEDNRRKQFVVCVACANGGWRPPGFSGLYSPRRA
ncbi:MAG TPA: hypothetical protein VMA09_01950 [Candidatus Binataceae bacterium]|nr:hypothetical protein [Candidatus Binataceae bacterium]